MAKLTKEQTKLASDIKRANQRLREMEKQNLESWSKAYEDFAGYFETDTIWNNENNLTAKTKKGQMKFRTDVAKVAKNPSLYNQLKDIVSNFLASDETSIMKLRERKRRVEEIQKNFENKFGSTFSGEKGKERINRAIDDEKLFNDLRARFGSEPAAIIMEDIAEGNLSRDKVEEYLNTVEYKRGETVANLYAYASNTQEDEWTRGDW